MEILSQPGPSLHQKDALAARLGGEQPRGLLSLRKLPAMREQVINSDHAVDDET
jgi:hypothetical protein